MITMTVMYYISMHSKQYNSNAMVPVAYDLLVNCCCVDIWYRFEPIGNRHALGIVIGKYSILRQPLA